VGDFLPKAVEAVEASNLRISHSRATLPKIHSSLGTLRIKAVELVWRLPSKAKGDKCHNFQTILPIKLRAARL